MPDSGIDFSATGALAPLKDFQRRTVDHVFDRLFLQNGSRRFLVADEVGLGKTLVARGVIARAVEHLSGNGGRIDILYICSNAAIAQQNINRLNIFDEQEFALATRLTLLPYEVNNLAQNKVNFISLTPGTTFDLKSRGGRDTERMLIYRILRRSDWAPGRSFLNLLQGSVTRRDRWLQRAKRHDVSIDPGLSAEFRAAVDADENLVARLRACCKHFRKYGTKVSDSVSSERYALIGELRHLLANVCIGALKPDLIILDEFQRFKELLNDESEAGHLAQKLFALPHARTLLLSATPYRLLSLDNERDDNHYADFFDTVKFLHDDADAAQSVAADIHRYRTALFTLSNDIGENLEQARGALQRQLLKVMCRTERVGMTRRLDAMLEDVEQTVVPEPADLHHALCVDRAARAVNTYEPIEYWKSAPFLFNFLRHYDLRRKIDLHAESPPSDLVDAIRKGSDRSLDSETINQYREVDLANARMRSLAHDTLDRGLWKLLWMPASLPYTRPGGVFENVTGVTKALVFSSWNVVPDAIAALLSYEAERRAVRQLGRAELRHDDLYDRIKPLLRFSIGADDRPTGMPALAWLIPWPRLAETIDPLEAALRIGEGELISHRDLLEDARRKCETMLEAITPGNVGGRVDERWYWAAPALLEQTDAVRAWCQRSDVHRLGRDQDGPGDGFRRHMDQLLQVMSNPHQLGPRPADLALVLAEMALGAPGICALRALRRVAAGISSGDPSLLSAAAQISSGFRSLFNLPESIALLRGQHTSGQDHGDDAYWRLTLRYAIEGNLQSLLDEQVHVLLESQGLSNQKLALRAEGIASALASALSLRTAQIKVDELSASDHAIETSSFNTRCRFAVRFGDLKDDRDEKLARAGTVRDAFNSPFRPFVLATTSIGQEGLDFHTWCHAVVHWNLPTNPVDLEQREGRVHRFKGHAVRKNIAQHYGLNALADWNPSGDPWAHLFRRAEVERAPGSSDLSPYWIFEEGESRIERRVPMLAFSREVQQLDRLKRNLALYRLVFGQPRQEDLLSFLTDRFGLTPGEAEEFGSRWRISLEPPARRMPATG